jgi:hypothetical protein
LLGLFLILGCNTLGISQPSPQLETTRPKSNSTNEIEKNINLEKTDPVPSVTPFNHPPQWLETEISEDTEKEYSNDRKHTLIGAVTTITISKASGPDGDPITYTWTASNVSITWEENIARWVRKVSNNRASDGKVVVTISDGRGGTNKWEITFKTIEGPPLVK